MPQVTVNGLPSDKSFTTTRNTSSGRKEQEWAWRDDSPMDLLRRCGERVARGGRVAQGWRVAVCVCVQGWGGR